MSEIEADTAGAGPGLEEPDPSARIVTVANLSVDVLRQSEDWPAVAALAPLVAACLAAARAEITPFPAGTVAVAFASDEGVRTLNAAFRGKDAPTNVLSFPAARGPAADPGHLGDVVLAAGVVRAEAAEAEKPLEDHLRHLVIHGFLHLLGHDHAESAAADVMEGLERRILARLGVPDPYEVGGAAPTAAGA